MRIDGEDEEGPFARRVTKFLFEAPRIGQVRRDFDSWLKRDLRRETRRQWPGAGIGRRFAVGRHVAAFATRSGISPAKLAAETVEQPVDLRPVGQWLRLWVARSHAVADFFEGQRTSRRAGENVLRESEDALGGEAARIDFQFAGEGSVIGGGRGELEQPVVRRRREIHRQSRERDAPQDFDDFRSGGQGVFIGEFVRLLPESLSVAFEVRMQGDEDVLSAAIFIKARFVRTFLCFDRSPQRNRRHAPTIRFAKGRTTTGEDAGENLLMRADAAQALEQLHDVLPQFRDGGVTAPALTRRGDGLAYPLAGDFKAGGEVALAGPDGNRGLTGHLPFQEGLKNFLFFREPSAALQIRRLFRDEIHALDRGRQLVIVRLWFD